MHKFPNQFARSQFSQGLSISLAWRIQHDAEPGTKKVTDTSKYNNKSSKFIEQIDEQANERRLIIIPINAAISAFLVQRTGTQTVLGESSERFGDDWSL